MFVLRELREDNKTYNKDEYAVLYQLYQFHSNIFNPKDVPMSLKQLSRAVGLGEKRVMAICEILVKDKLIRAIAVPHAMFYKITGGGIQFVEKYLTKQERVSAACR